MFRAVLLALLLLGLALPAIARNPNYYGTPRGVNARTYSGIYQAQRPNVVPTFSLPAYSGGYGVGYWGFYRGPYAGGYGYYPVYQPVVVYPPIIYGY